MKKLFGLGIAVGLVVSSASIAKESVSQLVLEEVIVQNVTVFKNLMPGPGPNPGMVGNTTVTALVASNGCTIGDDFELKFTQAGNSVLMRIVRVEPDPCDGVRTIKQVVIKGKGFNERLPLRIANPILVKKNIVH